MKRTLLLILFFLIIVLSTTIIALHFVLQPAFIKGMDLSQVKAANIGTALSGITTPFFTVISSTLIFFALMKQIEGNKDQRFKAEADMIFLLLNQLDVELEGYSMQLKPEGKDIVHINGYYALLKICGNEAKISDLNGFFDSTHGYKIILLLKSFSMVKSRIDMSNLSKDYQGLFYFKLYNFFRTRLKGSLNLLIENHNLRNELKINAAKFIVNFYDISIQQSKYFLNKY